MFIIFRVAQKESNRESNGLLVKFIWCGADFLKLKKKKSKSLDPGALKIALGINTVLRFMVQGSHYISFVSWCYRFNNILVETCNFSHGLDIKRPVCVHKLNTENEYIQILWNLNTNLLTTCQKEQKTVLIKSGLLHHSQKFFLIYFSIPIMISFIKHFL